MAVLAAVPAEVDTQLIRASRLPVVLVRPDIDLLHLQAEIESFIQRRRRELYLLDGELHRTLIEAAIAGVAPQLLLAEARRFARAALLDRGGDLHAVPPGVALTDAVVQRLRARVGVSHTSLVVIQGSPNIVACAVAAGQVVRGTVALVDVPERELDGAEIAIANLASACAIALTRDPVFLLPALDDLVAEQPACLADRSWVAAAIDCPTPLLEGLVRTLETELEARRIPYALAARDGTPVLFAATGDGAVWESLAAAVATRLALPSLRLGLSRRHDAPGEMFEAARQALEALRRGADRPVTRYEAVELDALLASLEGVDTFVNSRLGPLLDGSAGSDDLLRTLSTYLHTGRNAKVAAAHLALHRNTMSYRLRRIQDILGIDWNDADGMFALDLALRLWNRRSPRGVP